MGSEYVNTIGRLYITNLPPDLKSEELSSLFGRVCPVEDIYIPPKTVTGIHRNFAIVVVRGDEEQTKKCVKTFNACLWKGLKINVELAKEYFKDRLAKEQEILRNDFESDGELNDDDTSQDSANPCNNLPPFAEGELNIRPHRLQPMLAVSTVPILVTDSTKLSRQGLQSFDDTKRTVDAPFRSRKIVFDDEAFEHVNCISSESYEQMQRSYIANVDSDSKRVLEPQSTVKDSTDNSMGVKAKGVRKGFGTLMKGVENLSKLTERREDNDCCIEAKPSEKSKSELLPDFLLDDDSDINDGSLGRYNDDELDDDREFDFSSEKAQALRVLSALTPATKPISQKNLKGVTASKPAAIAAGVSSQLKRGNLLGSLIVQRYDPTKNISYDANPTSYTAHLEPPEDVSSTDEDENCIGNDDDNEEEKEEEEENKDGFANLYKLKDIFHKEGGVWWGDDGTMSEEVKKGDIVQDPLFLEAEKLGIDIRAPDDPSRKSMLFSFFDDVEDDMIPSNPFLSKSIEAETTLIAHDESTASHESHSGQHKSFSNDDEPPEVISFKPMSLIDIVNSAKRFKRDRSESELIEEWKANKDRMVLDYKRKKRDAKRHMKRKAL